MSSFAKPLAVLLAGLLATSMAADKPVDPKAKKPDTKESTEKKGKKGKASEADKAKKKAEEDPDAPPKPFEVPMPTGRGATGIKIPYRNTEGKLTLRYTIGKATKVDESHMEMSDLTVETFDENGDPELTMDLPTSTMDLTTWVITAYQPVKIKRDDFELTGNTMIFNTRTKQGGLGGNVHMLIYNLFDEPEKAPDAAAPGSDKPASEIPAAATSAAATPATPEPKAK